MAKPLLILFLTLFVLFVLGRGQQKDPDRLREKYLLADKQFREAEKLSASAGDNEKVQAKADALYQQSLAQFTPLLQQAIQVRNDSLHYLIRVRIAYIEYFFDSLVMAKENYSAAIRLNERSRAIPDSLLFAPYLYLGSIFYSQNEFDSALNFYKKAEYIADHSSGRQPDIQRLYNRLGVMFYEMGNYREAKNHFEKAIAMTPASEHSLIDNYRINIASLLVKLEELDKARDIYQSLLPSAIFSNEIYHNLGIINLKQKDFVKATYYLEKVSYGNDKKNIDLFYNMAMAMAGTGANDSADYYLLKARAENIKWNGRKKNTANGLLLKFEADELSDKKQFDLAIPLYQQAICQFAPEFNDTALGKNPDLFTAVHSYINLFNTLSAKANTLYLKYKESNSLTALENALATYRSAFQLADHVEKTYNSDEARLFLGKIKYAVHSYPIDIGIKLYQLTQKKEYLEDIYFFDQQNKASVLALNVWEKKLRSSNPSLDKLYQQESALRSLITRNSIKAAATTDSNGITLLNSVIRDKEIDLNKVQESIKEESGNAMASIHGQVPTIHDLQRKLDDHTAIISYHLSQKELLILVISANKFYHHQATIDTGFYDQISKFKNALYEEKPGERYQGTEQAIYLYRQLLLPAIAELSNIKRLIIIPDDELNYLPFEALQDERKNYLLQRFSIQYQYATSLIGTGLQHRSEGATLSIAPFVSGGSKDENGNVFSALPASANEISHPGSKKMIDSAATKDRFLSLARHYSVLHFATHAVANNRDPMLSYIAFYPSTADNKLYAQEIYDLQLDSASLVILSACETGNGQLVKGEGLMSLSRAFAYAGCPNIIASLWKAEDRTTAFLSQRLHFYLSKNYNKDIALQRAKLDLLNSNEIDASLKTPNYWSHLVLIGEYEPNHKRSNWPWVAIGILALLLAYAGIKKISPPLKEKRRA